MQTTGKYELCLPVEQTTDLEDTVLLSKPKQKKDITYTIRNICIHILDFPPY